jgi:monoamine oxidase
MEGWLAEPAGNLFFAGEHTDSFHNFQGFMEGAASSGERAAGLILERMNIRQAF